MKVNLSTININININNAVDMPTAQELHKLCYQVTGNEYINEEGKPSPFQPLIKSWEKNEEETRANIQIKAINRNYTNETIDYLEHNNSIYLKGYNFNLISYEVYNNYSIDLNETTLLPPTKFKVSLETPILLSKEQVTDRGVVFNEINKLEFKTFIESMQHFIEDYFDYSFNLNNIKNIYLNCNVTEENYKEVESDSSDKALQGSFLVDYSNLSIEEQSDLGKLLNLSSYIGVGNKRAYGYGVIGLERVN